jgi:small subunit ribosomal protein S21
MVKLVVRDRESIQEAVRRFRKLVERSGIKKEMRRREYYEKPSETKRRTKLRAERRGRDRQEQQASDVDPPATDPVGERADVRANDDPRPGQQCHMDADAEAAHPHRLAQVQPQPHQQSALSQPAEQRDHQQGGQAGTHDHGTQGAHLVRE